jgi:hypothetical protein
MKLGEIIPEGCVLDDLKSTQKEDVIKEMVAALAAAGKVDDPSSKKVIKALMDRHWRRRGRAAREERLRQRPGLRAGALEEGHQF